MPAKPTPIRIVTWNVARRDASVRDALEKAVGSASRLDLLVLQEVGPAHSEGFRERLVKFDLRHVYYTAHLDLPCLCEINVIGSRWPLDATELRYARKELPWPQALTRASVSVNGHSILVLTAHIPNGTRHGWEKIDTFKVLNELVLQAKGTPSIVAGDFNEPQYHRLVNEPHSTVGRLRQCLKRDGRLAQRCV
jgi:endonuclease/exonuclease/phosphatase family metal-dependent hydrolase